MQRVLYQKKGIMTHKDLLASGAMNEKILFYYLTAQQFKNESVAALMFGNQEE